LPDKKGTQSKAATHINMQHPHTNTHTHSIMANYIYTSK